MKTIKSYLCFALFCLLTGHVHVSAASGYEDIMHTALEKLDTVENANDLLSCKNQFERIAAMYPDNWLPAYYVAYCDIQMVFYPGNHEKQPWLDSAESRLRLLEKMKGADLSEVSTLWGYYYNALTVADPQNGQTYYRQVLESYENAIKLNPENPRPVCLSAFYKQYLPPFLKSENEIAEGKEKAKELFAKEKRSTEKPYWGAFFLDMIRTEGNNNQKEIR